MFLFSECGEWVESKGLLMREGVGVRAVVHV